MDRSIAADPVLDWLRSGVVGRDARVRTPFGDQPKRYFDYAASGLPFGPIEDLVRERVLPWMANTHTAANATGDYMTGLYRQAHEKIARHVNAGTEDAVIFCGSGATGAVNKLVRALGLLVPEPIERVLEIRKRIPERERAVVFLSRMEHHSNDLPWRESVADVVMVGFDDLGRVSPDELDRVIADPRWRDRPLKIGSFSAASNVTGIVNDVHALARVMHRHGGFACFDFAAAAPYVEIDMHPEGDPDSALDAIFASMHKFLGGPQAPGLLVANAALFRSRVPVEPGGGTVLYTSPWEWRYTDRIGAREEGGTPNVVGAIRAGLAVELKDTVGVPRIRATEASFVRRAIDRLRGNARVRILGDPKAPRLGILSLVFEEGRLHHNLAARILSDRFGIQSRGGCMCAGTYGHELLGIGAERSAEIGRALARGDETAKPGWLRISFSPATTDEEFSVLLDALTEISERWREWSREYTVDPRTAFWWHEKDREVSQAKGEDLRLEVPAF